MLILPAAPAAAVSGKQDDSIVYFLWRGNQAARSYNTPANPQTTNQQAVRGFLATLSAEWSTLSAGDRDTWTEYSTSHPTSDRFGRPVTPTGLNWYVKANTNRLIMALAAVDTAPIVSAPAPVLAAAVTATASTGVIAATFTWDTTGGTFRVKGQCEFPPTAAWTPSISRARLIAGVNINSTQALDPGDSQSVSFTSDRSFSAGQTVNVWLTIVNEVNGLESLPFLTSVVAV
jgi:hypothetical protein